VVVGDNTNDGEKKMIRGIYLIILFFLCVQSNAQKNIDLIISIDDNIAVGSISDLKLVAVSTNGSEKIINADYYPGNLTLSNSDYKNLLDTGIKTVHIVFNYIEYQDGKQQFYSYDIDLNKGWLQHYYYILHIYNTTKKKYSKMFIVPKGEKYVYEFDYPGGSTKLIRKG
jgi:hypothetical protein